MKRPPIQRCQSKPRHRGAALLVVLAVLVLAVTVCTILAQSAATAQLQRRVDACSSRAGELLLAAETPIQNWLASKAASIVLPDDVTEPRVEILNDRFSIDDLECELTITAWDECGMAPWRLVKGASPIRMALPSDFAHRVDAMIDSPTNPMGLDQFTRGIEEGLSSSPFPASASSELVEFGTMRARASDSEGDDGVSIAKSEPAIGALIATHNESAQFNANTTPLPLLEAAMRAAGRGGIQQIVEARRRGKPAAPVVQQKGDSSFGDSLRPSIVTASNAWAFRIDVQAGPVHRSWWAVYTPTKTVGPRSDGSSSPLPLPAWSCRQRLVINQ